MAERSSGRLVQAVLGPPFVVGAVTLTPQGRLIGWQSGGGAAAAGGAAWLRLEPTEVVVQHPTGQLETVSLPDPTRDVLGVLGALALLVAVLALPIGRWLAGHRTGALPVALSR